MLICLCRRSCRLALALALSHTHSLSLSRARALSLSPAVYLSAYLSVCRCLSLGLYLYLSPCLHIFSVSSQWVNLQRQLFHANVLAPKCVSQLKALGFCFEGRAASKLRWRQERTKSRAAACGGLRGAGLAVDPKIAKRQREFARMSGMGLFASLIGLFCSLIKSILFAKRQSEFARVSGMPVSIVNRSL
jgi:hypothetical protein